MLSLASTSLAYAGSAAPTMMRTAAPMMGARRGTPSKKRSVGGGAAVAELESLVEAQKIPGVNGVWDPLGFTKIDLWETGEEASVAWLRQAEVKHGRIAMFGFVGYIVHANHIVFPWALTGGPAGTGPTTMFSDISAAGSPIDQWAAVPTAGKLQILGTIALLEYVAESTKPHYMNGGKIGYIPPLSEFEGIPHPVPFNLYDPFNLFAGMSEENKARGLTVEINNGRAAMLGIFGFISAEKGLIGPGLDSFVVEKSTGEPMAFFGPGDGGLPFVTQMFDNWNLPF